MTAIERAIRSWSILTGFDIGPCTTGLETKRHRAYKRSCFQKAFSALRNLDGKPIKGGRIIYTMSRQECRAAAWKTAIKQAEESRATV